MTNDPDRDWEQWGRTNPYYGVYRDPKFLRTKLDQESLRDFFASGEQHIEHVYETLRLRIDPSFSPRRILDYGCGVGRLLLSLRRRCDSVTGVDVSTSMLLQAADNCRESGAPCQLLHVNEMQFLPSKSFDFIHSYIVFQHIPVSRGELIFKTLLDLLADEGFGAVQFTFSDARTGARARVHRVTSHLRVKFSIINGVFNLIRGRAFSSPIMQMNIYKLSRILDCLIQAGCSSSFVEFSDHGGFHGALLYFQKRSPPSVAKLGDAA